LDTAKIFTGTYSEFLFYFFQPYNDLWEFPNPGIFPPKAIFGGKSITVRTSGSPNRQAVVEVKEYPGKTVEDSSLPFSLYFCVLIL